MLLTKQSTHARGPGDPRMLRVSSRHWLPATGAPGNRPSAGAASSHEVDRYGERQSRAAPRAAAYISSTESLFTGRSVLSLTRCAAPVRSGRAGLFELWLRFAVLYRRRQNRGAGLARAAI